MTGRVPSRFSGVPEVNLGRWQVAEEVELAPHHIIISIVARPARPSVAHDRLNLREEGPSALRMTWTDEELVARSIGGDAESFNELIHRWERPIYALAYRQIGREEDARDVCQETFLRAFRALKGFRGQAKFSSWLYRIALNLCRDWMRRERRTPVVQVLEDVDLMDLAAAREPSESIEDRVARHDLTRNVERAMALLPEEQRTAIVLKEYHGLTFQEIADLVGCPLSTVKTRLYQGLAVLRRELARTGASVAAR